MIAMLALTMVASGCVGSLQDNTDTNSEQPEEEPVDTENTSTETEVDRTVRITGYSNISYNTDSVNVEEGETVRFVYENEGGFHDLVLERNGEDVASTDTLSSSGATDSFTHTFEEDGEYLFYCSVGSHRAQGMEGTVNLQSN